MKAKAAEVAFRDMAARYDYGRHKYGDVRYCIHCKKAQPKSEHAPDYSMWEVYNWIECKNNPDSSPRWNWTEISEEGERKNQRKFLLKNDGWLFIVLGTGRAPKGKSAFFLPFSDWVEKIEPILNENNMRSIRKSSKGKRPGADLILQSYRLKWDKGGWIIPEGHLFWADLFERLCVELGKIYPLLTED